MNQQKGFSLVEVLVSLLLLSTLALSLVQQQLYNKQLLRQLILRDQKLQINETASSYEKTTWS